MDEVELSLITKTSSTKVLEDALSLFTEQTGIKVHVSYMNWNTAWANLFKNGLYRSGPDVSEVGSTWMGDLVEMEALRPFSAYDVENMGGARAFLEASWQTVSVSSAQAGGNSVGEEVYGIPWFADSRLLFYRRDLLAQAGADPAMLKSHSGLLSVLRNLKVAGIELPLVLPTRRSRMTLHNAACWVWGAGGHFLSPDGKRPTFNQAAALEGFRQYFELSRFLPPASRELDEAEADSLFATGKAAICISGPWITKNWVSSPEVRQQIGITFPPGVPFIGGSNLVVWNYSRRGRAAAALVQFLVGHDFQQRILADVALLPARRDVLSTPPFSESPFFGPLSEGLHVGRSFRLARRWGLVEDRLSDSLNKLWPEVLKLTTFNSLLPMLKKELDPLASRLTANLSDLDTSDRLGF